MNTKIPAVSIFFGIFAGNWAMIAVYSLSVTLAVGLSAAWFMYYLLSFIKGLVNNEEE
jgi:hypothetical protein